MAYNPITAIKKNSYHSQEMLAAAGATVLLHLASKTRFFSTLTWGQAANAAANGASLAVASKSAYTFFTTTDGDGKRVARKSFVASLLVGALATTAGITNISETKFSGLPQLKEMKDMKVFGYATVAGGITSAMMTEGGVRGVKYVHSTYTAWAQARAVKKDEDTFTKAVQLVETTAVDQMATKTPEEIKALHAAFTLVKAVNTPMDSGWTPTDESAKATDEKRDAINARAAELNKIPATRIDGWVNLT